MKRFMCWLILVLLVAGCAVNPTPAPTVSVPTQAPTWTPQPTYTPRPTHTPYPTYTPLRTAAFLPTSAPAPAPTAAPTPLTYVVQPGDMLSAIADQYQVPIDELITANAIQNMDIITVGQVLVIPVTPTLTLTGTAVMTPTARPIVARPAAPAAPPARPSNFVYSAPRILYPDNGITLKYDARNRNGGTEDITFVWLPVGSLESGTQPCTWQGQPNGADGWLWDRYHIEFDPPLYESKLNRWLNVVHNDQGTSRVFSLLEFKPDVTYAWRVAVGRWCVSRNYDNQDPKHQGFLGLVSPYTALRTFRYTP